MRAVTTTAGCLAALALGCHDVQHPVSLPVVERPPMCSQLRRDVSKWQNAEIPDCGPDVSGLIELLPIGNDRLLARKRFAPNDELWQLTHEGAVADAPTRVEQMTDAGFAGFTFLPGSPDRILGYDPRLSQWNLYVARSSTATGGLFATAAEGQWPSGYWPPNLNGGPWNHQFIGLEDGHILDRDLGDGSVRIWRVATGLLAATRPIELVASETLVAGPEDRFRRGHRLVHLGEGRLLEWLPRVCARDASSNGTCGGSDFTVWSYSLDSAAGLNPTVVSSGSWDDIGNESDLVADTRHLFVWTRPTGRLRSYALDPTLADPLSQPPVAEQPPNNGLASQIWTPPTTAPAIKHLVLILQDGRSFDSYFGRYCQGGPSDAGAALPCTTGASCCETMPAVVPGGGSCVDPESDPAHRPADSPACLRAKMDDGAMDGFAIARPPDACGDPRDFACGDPTGALARYRDLAAEGALADRFFQSYAFLDGGGMTMTSDPDALLQNLLYLVTSRFAGFPPLLTDTPLLTKELVRLQVPWAIYAGPVNLPQLRAFGVPLFYDPDWFPYRSLNGGELEHDIAVGALEAVTVILPDRGDPLRSESPGHPLAPAIEFTDSVLKAVAASPYASDTLVLVTHLTAGGFYDHVPPPPPPPLAIDASSGSATQATAVHYGPRAPLLAVGRFARSNVISHVQLEISSVTKFVEWNWLHGSALKGIHEPDDLRRYRDTTVNNLGSLIDPLAAGAEVPIGRE